MSDPIINPWLIYLIGIVDVLRLMFFCMGFITCSIVLFPFITVLMDDSEIKFTKKINVCISLSIIFMALWALIPSKETLTAMVVAGYVTPENINGATNFTAEQVDKILKVVIENINDVNGGK